MKCQIVYLLFLWNRARINEEKPLTKAARTGTGGCRNAAGREKGAGTVKTIGIDLGTTTISAAVLDCGRNAVLESRTVPNDSFMETGRPWERIQDAGRIVEKAVCLLDELLRDYPDAAAIGLTGQMHGILYADGGGNRLSPLYTWQDRRCAQKDADGRTFTEWLRTRCGAAVPAGYGLGTHAWLHREGGIPEGAASLCTAADYLGMALTGRTRPLLHTSMAASLGFFRADTGRFRTDLLEELGLDPGILPEVTDGPAALGHYRGRPVAAALGDNQASFLGAAGYGGEDVLVNVGTGGQISVASDHYAEIEGIETRPLTGGRFLLVGASLCGGRAYAVLERFFRSYLAAAGCGEEEQYAVMGKLAEAAERKNRAKPAGETGFPREGAGAEGANASGAGLKVCTAFCGSRTDPDLRGSMTGLTEDNFTPENLIYGMLFGIAEELYQMYERVRRETGLRARTVAASGSGVRKNPALRHILEDLFGVPLRLTECVEEAACGAALNAAELVVGEAPGKKTETAGGNKDAVS